MCGTIKQRHAPEIRRSRAGASRDVVCRQRRATARTSSEPTYRAQSNVGVRQIRSVGSSAGFAGAIGNVETSRASEASQPSRRGGGGYRGERRFAAPDVDAHQISRRVGALVLRAEAFELFGVELHAEGEAHLAEDRLDLVEGLLAKVLGLEQL